MLRVHSLFITKYITSKHDGMSGYGKCARLRFQVNPLTPCAYYAYHLDVCMFFKDNIPNEVVSRLLFQKWNYGRVMSNGRVSKGCSISIF